jgi:Sulfotransferase family
LPLATSDQRLPGIVFILSTPRAGSTLLRVMLAGHSRLFSPPELHLLVFDSMRQRRNALDGSRLDEGLQVALTELLSRNADESKQVLNEWIEQDLPIQAVYARLQAMACGRVLVDKSPSYGGSLETLQRAEALFDRAKYIHLARHPYAVIESFVRLRMDRLAGAEDVDAYAQAERVWSTSNQNMLQFLESVDPGRWLRLSYEDLVRRPEPLMHDICAFLDLPFEQATLTPYEGKRMTDGLNAHTQAIADPNFLSHTTIEPELADAWCMVRLPRCLGDAARRIAATLHYTLPDTGMAMLR